MRRRLLLGAIEIAAPLAVIGAIVAWTHGAHDFYFPPVTKVWNAFLDTFLESGTGVNDVLWPTLKRMLAGYLAAVAGGIGIGIVLASSQRLLRMFSPIVEFLRATPSPTMIPVIVLIFGVGDSAKIILITLGCVWPILLNTLDGMQGVDPVLLETSRSYGVGPIARVGYVRLPAAAPQIFAGMRTSLAIALILAVVSEFLASTNGIGFYINEGQSLFKLPQMWVGIIVIGVVGYALNVVFLLVENRVLRWHRDARMGTEA